MIYTGQVASINEVLDASPVCTVTTAGGARLFPCYIMSVGGGYQAALSTPPLKVGAAVVVIKPDQNAPFLIMGGVPSPSDLQRIALEGNTAADNQDYREHAVDETIIRNTNSTLTLSPRNDAVLDAPTIKLQLQGGTLRVSQQNTADNGVLNAQPFIDVLFQYLSELDIRIGTLDRSVTALYNTLSADIATEAAEIGGRQTAGTATPADIERLAEITQLLTDIPTLQVPITAANVVQSNAERSINDHILIP